ncbi:MAG: leucine-rich repeat domain-containing protein [Oscillospiraceae bacterium]|nr:leucine-rich repeat domain-containing protein [Oscillospiraceae bacterium]
MSDFEYKYDATAGGIVITKYIGTSIKVKIPKKIEGEFVVWIGDNAFIHSGIMEVYIPNSITNIGDYAFWNCTGLKNVAIPDSVTKIRYTSFACYKLTATYKGKTYHAEKREGDPNVPYNMPSEFYDTINGR